ncbi:protein Peter pan-like [Linepithema humile]|uniref:protein Peter pan-like n=1 Tax=Linepithema humile TaxID=83485 RepID=UPI00351E89CC
MESAQATSSKINKGGIRKKMSKLGINPDKELEDDLLKDVDMVEQDIQLHDAAEKIKKLEEELESLKKIVAKKKENEEKGKKENEEKGKKENKDEKKRKKKRVKWKIDSQDQDGTEVVGVNVTIRILTKSAVDAHLFLTCDLTYNILYLTYNIYSVLLGIILCSVF